MTDPDDEAFTWEGDERLRAPARPDVAPAPEGDRAARFAGGPLELVGLGVLAGVALLETAFWLRGVLQPAIAGSVTTGGGTVGEVLAYAVNLVGRALAVLAPLAWFGAAARWIRNPPRRFAWLLLGAVLLVPWPAVLAAS